MTIIAADTNYLVVGLGLTGLSCVRYLRSINKAVSVIDSRQNPPGLEQLKNEFPDIQVHCGSFDEGIISKSNVLVVSPGVPLATPEIKNALESGVQLTSDIELFLKQFAGKVVAITGSNAKSTVTAWLGDALLMGKNKVLIAGNIGVPVLDAVGEEFDIAVLELSSFQLELLPKLNADISTILNVSEDHMDRYDSMAAYQQAKQRIYYGCKTVLYNRDDALTSPLVSDDVTKITFGSNSPDLKQYGFHNDGGQQFLAKGFDSVIDCSELGLPGRHNMLNALTVLALADYLENDRTATLSSLRSYTGLPYRCQLSRVYRGVEYFNDSKATNVGSTLAALSGLGDANRKSIFLLLGGQAKGQDLQPLKSPVEHFCKVVYLFGEDAHLFEKYVPNAIRVDSMEAALKDASTKVCSGDVVLLSPASASFDQFSSFEHRGQTFDELVRAIK